MQSDMLSERRPQVVSIVGKSDSGKTTLIEKLLPALIERGVRVGTIKHDVHGFEMDREGKDSYRHKHAGAAVTLISSPRQVGMVRDVSHDHRIEELLKPKIKTITQLVPNRRSLTLVARRAVILQILLDRVPR